MDAQYGKKPKWSRIEQVRIDAATTNLNYLVADRVVNTQVSLTRHGRVNDPFFPLCMEEEKLDHLFVECEDESALWR